LHTSYDEDYTYDDLDRLTYSDRAGSFDQTWTLDGLGNWSAFDEDTDGDGTIDAGEDVYIWLRGGYDGYWQSRGNARTMTTRKQVFTP